MRILALALAVLAGPTLAEVSVSPRILAARLAEPTDRYGHAVLGETPEWGAIQIDTVRGSVTIRLPETRVFEDIEARLADLDGDGGPEVIVVESDLSLGASLAVYGPKGKIAATQFIGQSNRWLAPAGIADFDGDGRVEIAYVDRPHLLGELVYVRLEGDRLVETLRLPGLTNHRIGDDFISGGVRDCGKGPELILASKDWSRVLRVRDGVSEDIGPMPVGALTVPAC
ncbi:MAG: VCBS repeat-containing protein [Tabrizicola sp.]|jgi:hypothetical protein|nr:VCBS repeat-containing protein [Tabrizicola sp.]